MCIESGSTNQSPGSVLADQSQARKLTRLYLFTCDEQYYSKGTWKTCECKEEHLASFLSSVMNKYVFLPVIKIDWIFQRVSKKNVPLEIEEPREKEYFI